MFKEELVKLNRQNKDIDILKSNIEQAQKTITILETTQSKFYRIEIYTYNNLNAGLNDLVNTDKLLGVKEIVRALKDSISATKGYLHHLEKEFNRR